MRITIGAVLILTLSSCSQLSPLGFLSSGVNTAANVQAGKTNSQTLGTTKITEQKTTSGNIKSVESKVSAEEVKTVVVNEIQPWVILLLILGWLLPSPQEIGRGILRLFTKKTIT